MNFLANLFKIQKYNSKAEIKKLQNKPQISGRSEFEVDDTNLTRS